MPLTKQVVEGQLNKLADAYNAGNFTECGALYSSPCDVKVTTGGAPSPYESPTAVANFLKTLSDGGSKHMKFTSTVVDEAKNTSEGAHPPAM